MANRQWFVEGVQVFETGEEEYFVEGVQLNEDQADVTPPAADQPAIAFGANF